MKEKKKFKKRKKNFDTSDDLYSKKKPGKKHDQKQGKKFSIYDTWDEEEE